MDGGRAGSAGTSGRLRVVARCDGEADGVAQGGRDCRSAGIGGSCRG